MNVNPIFICGSDRSGTTMLASMLGAAKDTVVTPESHFKFEILKKGNYQWTKDKVEDWIQYWAKNKRFRVWLENQDFHKKLINTEWHDYSTREFLSYLAFFYDSQIEDNYIWIDHTPANVFYIDELKNIFPDAKLIHIVRDGRDVAKSVIPLPWGPNTIEHVVNWWLIRMAPGLAAETNKDYNIYRVYYEDIITKPETTLRYLCDFLNINYNPDMLSANAFQVPNYTKFQHQLVGKSINKNNKNYFDKLRSREVEIFEYFAGSILMYLGYKLIFDSPKSLTTKESLLNKMYNYFRVYYNKRIDKKRLTSLPRLGEFE